MSVDFLFDHIFFGRSPVRISLKMLAVTFAGEFLSFRIRCTSCIGFLLIARIYIRVRRMHMSSKSDHFTCHSNSPNRFQFLWYSVVFDRFDVVSVRPPYWHLTTNERKEIKHWLHYHTVTEMWKKIGHSHFVVEMFTFLACENVTFTPSKYLMSLTLTHSQLICVLKSLIAFTHAHKSTNGTNMRQMKWKIWRIPVKPLSSKTFLVSHTHLPSLYHSIFVLTHPLSNISPTTLSPHKFLRILKPKPIHLKALLILYSSLENCL